MRRTLDTRSRPLPPHEEGVRRRGRPNLARSSDRSVNGYRPDQIGRSSQRSRSGRKVRVRRRPLTSASSAALNRRELSCGRRTRQCVDDDRQVDDSRTNAPSAGSRSPKAANPMRPTKAPIPATDTLPGDAPCVVALIAIAVPSRSTIDRQDDVGGLGGRRAPTRSDGNPDIRDGQSGSIVYTVPDHDGGPEPASSRTASTFSAGVRSASTSSTPITAPTVSATSALSPVTITTLCDAVTMKLPDWAPASGSDTGRRE